MTNLATREAAILARTERDDPAERIGRSGLKILKGSCAFSEERIREHQRFIRQREAWERAMDRWSGCGVPLRHARTLPIGPARWMAALVKVSDALKGGTVVVLCGPRSTGKTQLAARLMSESIVGGKPARYYRLVEVYDLLRDSFAAGDRRAGDLMRRFSQPPLLVLDECHDRGETEWERRKLNELCDVRYCEMKPTLLITNNTLNELRDSLGPTILERSSEGGGVIVLEGMNFRRASR